MKDKQSSDSNSSNENREINDPGDQMEDEFKAFEKLISPEDNVEYEQDPEIDLFEREKQHDKWRIQEHKPIQTPLLQSGENKNVTIPLQVKLPGGSSADYVLNLSFSLHRVSNQDPSVLNSGSSMYSTLEDEDLEIDILDGRTTLIFDEEEEENDKEEREAHVDLQESWLQRLFSFRKNKD